LICHPQTNLEYGKLGANLPTNDQTKTGQLDNLSVDSYWVDEEEIDEIDKEKQLDPVTLDYKAVYHRNRDGPNPKKKYKKKPERRASDEENNNISSDENNNKEEGKRDKNKENSGNEKLTILAGSSRNK
jgi:hypothetical protein